MQLQRVKRCIGYDGLMIVRCAILIGGQSSRMGTPKSALPLAGRSLPRILADTLGPLLRNVVLVGDAPLADDARHLPRIADAPDVKGPLAGILAAMMSAPHSPWLVIACDMPLVSTDAIRWIVWQRQPGAIAVLPRLAPDRVEPLFAIYEPAAHAPLQSLAAEGVMSPRTLADDPRVLSPLVPEHLRSAWSNGNTPDEFEAIRRAASP